MMKRAVKMDVDSIDEHRPSTSNKDRKQAVMLKVPQKVKILKKEIIIFLNLNLN